MAARYSRAAPGPQGYPFDDDPPPAMASTLVEPERMAHLPENRKVHGAAKPGKSKLTVGQQRRFKRDLLIYGGYKKLGFSQRQLAEVFDLPRSRIGTIIQACRDLEFERRSHGRT